MRRIVLVMAAFAAAAASVYAIQLKDDRGITLVLPTRAQRIVALSPHLVEIAYAAGAGTQLAAAVRYSDYPQAAARLPRVGDASRVDLERLLVIQPDLILAWQSGNPAADLQRLERRGFRVFVTEPRRLADISRLVRTVGMLAGSEPAAEASAAAFDAVLEALRQRYSARAPVRVFYEIWHRPLLTVNAAHLISDVIALCGGRNVFAEAAVLTPSVSLEAVLQARPQLMLGGSSAMRPEDLGAEWRHSPAAALREIPVRYIPPDVIQRQTPRIAEGAKRVCEAIDEVRQRATER